MTEDWRERAACKGCPIEWWFPREQASDVRAIRRCVECSVQDECWEACKEFEFSWRWGIWAGTTASDRHAWGDRPGRPPIKPTLFG